jgi:hypothetical protein
MPFGSRPVLVTSRKGMEASTSTQGKPALLDTRASHARRPSGILSSCAAHCGVSATTQHRQGAPQARTCGRLSKFARGAAAWQPHQPLASHLTVAEWGLGRGAGPGLCLVVDELPPISGALSRLEPREHDQCFFLVLTTCLTLASYPPCEPGKPCAVRPFASCGGKGILPVPDD